MKKSATSSTKVINLKDQDYKLESKSLPTEIFRRSPNKNSLEIPFTELVNDEFPEGINIFDLTKKRTYCNIMDSIIKSNNELLAEYPHKDDIIMSYLSIKWKIDHHEYKDNEEKKLSAEKYFFNDVYNLIMTSEFINYVKDYVEENYKLNIDEENKASNKHYNPVLQFSDMHCKILHCISISTKMIIPLVTVFKKYYENSNTNDYLQRAFDPLFRIFSYSPQGKKIDICSKLRESVKSRVDPTKNSDKSYWNYVEIKGMTLNKLIDSIYQKLIVDIVPKYDLEQNLVNLNHVITNNNINFTFRENIPINYKPLNAAESEDDVSDFDKLSINTARIDEGIIVMNECNIMQTIPLLKKKYKITITDEEYEFYDTNFKINEIRTDFMKDFFSRYFGSKDTICFGNKHDYIELMIIMKRMLIQDGFNILPSILTATVDNINEKSTINKKILMKAKESNEYHYLLNTKYNFVQKSIEQSCSLVVGKLADVINNKFYYNDYDDKKNNDEEIKITNYDLLLEEILRFDELI